MARNWLNSGRFFAAGLLAWPAVAVAEPQALASRGGDSLAGLIGELETPLDEPGTGFERLPDVDAPRVVRVAVARGATLVLGAGALLVGSIDGVVVWEGAGPVELRADSGAAVAVGRSATHWSWRSTGGVTLGGVEAGREVDVVVKGGALVAVEPIPLESYVASVVGAEMPASWPAAALEAQAIAARTYVLRKLERVAPDALYDIEAGVVHQAYKGRASLDPRTEAAAEATRGQVLRAGDALAEAYFHALCVGRSESAAAAFGAGPAYLQPVACQAPPDAPYASWERTFELDALAKRLRDDGTLGDTLQRIEVLSRTSSGRIERVRLVTKRGGRELGGGELRRLLGWDALPSLAADVRKRGNSLVFTGRGRGHGVGLCQWCARGMADGGTDARSILAHFYPTTRIDTLAAR